MTTTLMQSCNLNIYFTFTIFQVFHICWPIQDDYGSVIETAHWSFICGNGTIFDQQILGGLHVH